MKVNVKKTFKDKNTGVIHYAGTEFECSEERANELKEAGDYVCDIAQDSKEEMDNQQHEEQGKEEGEQKPKEDEVEKLAEMEYSDLKHLAKELGIPAKGTKEELVNAISEAKEA